MIDRNDAVKNLCFLQHRLLRVTVLNHIWFEHAHSRVK